MRLLLTGFEPFDGSPVNPSQQVMKALSGKTVSGLKIVTAVLPVDHARGPARLLAALRRVRPDAVLCLGQATRRAALSVERVGINLVEHRGEDGALTGTEGPVVPGGPDAYFATVPVHALRDAIRAAGVPAELSLSAGTYLCNQVLYTALHFAAAHRPGLRAGFIHVPALPEQVRAAHGSVASMSLATTLRGVRAAIRALAGDLRGSRITD